MSQPDSRPPTRRERQRRRPDASELRILDALATYGPQTSDELAIRLDLTVQIVRRHLRRMAEWELAAQITREQVAVHAGPGAIVWHLHARLGRPAAPRSGVRP